MHTLITISTPAGLKLQVVQDDHQVIDGRVTTGGLYVVDANDDLTAAGQLGIGAGAAAPATVYWTQDGYQTKAPSWAEEGTQLLFACVSGDELPEGWEVVS